EATRPFDHGEHARLRVGLLALRAHHVGGGAAHPYVGLGPVNLPSRLEGTVQLLLRGGIDERVEHDLGRCVVQVLELQLVAHVTSPFGSGSGRKTVTATAIATTTNPTAIPNAR